MTRPGIRLAGRAAQRGVTLLIGMVMLVLITVIVLASYHLGRNNVEIVGNAQQRGEGLAAAQQTIEAAFASPLLTTSPSSVFNTPCAGFGDNTQCYDVNGDGKDDVVVRIEPTPTCIKAQPIPVTSLNITDPNDQLCTISVNQGAFGVGSASNNSNCANTVWDVRAVANNLDATGTAVMTPGPTSIVNQGIAVRVETAVVDTSCP
jgi:Tfp pilus assembly protein PilX